MVIKNAEYKRAPVLAPCLFIIMDETYCPHVSSYDQSCTRQPVLWITLPEYILCHFCYVPDDEEDDGIL